MVSTSTDVEPHERPELEFYRRALMFLNDAGAPYLVGGAYAYAHYTGVHRHTKDCDIFVHRRDTGRVLDLLAGAGYRTEVTFTHWLAKAFCGDYLIDVIFGSGNGLCGVDDEWFTHARRAPLLGVPVGLIPPEEMIWSKAFIMERERYDGSDINHLLYCCGPRLDWDRLLARFGDHWPVLLSHIVLFTFAYPDARDRVPRRIVDELLARAARDAAGAAGNGAANGERICRGTLLSRQYLHDVRTADYRDARVHPWGALSEEQLARWTAAFEKR